MSRCGGCGKAVRAARMIYVSDGRGGLARKRVGRCCIGKAVTILAGAIEGGRCACGAPATTCIGCARDGEKKDAKKTWAPAAKKLRTLAALYRKSPGAASVSGDEGFADGRAAGLEQAADLLEAGDFS